MKKNIDRLVLLFFALAFPCVQNVAAQLDVMDYAGDLTTLAEELGVDPTLAMRAPTPEEWKQFWDYVANVRQSESLEELAYLRPYATMALDYMDKVPEARPYADWLRQRMDYLWMAEEIVKEERPATKAPPPVTSRPTSIAPPPAKPSAPSAARAKKKSMDVDRWVKRMEKRPPPANARIFVPVLKPIFRQHGVPEQLVWLAEVESSFDPLAKSPVGALGLYQFMPSTAERFGLALKPKDQRTVPEHSATAAAKYLKFLHGRFGSWPLALAAYNAGEGRVGKLLSKHKANSFEGIADYLPAETRMYVPKVSAVVRLREGADLKNL